MVTLANGGAWLVNGAEIIADGPKAQAELAAKTGRTVSKEEAKKQTIAYGILENHNTSGNMEKLKIKFDKLTSHDITFVGIIQTARASGSVSYTHLWRLMGTMRTMKEAALRCAWIRFSSMREW